MKTAQPTEKLPNQSSQLFQPTQLMEEFLKDNADDLEGIIQNEPAKNKYETIRYHKMNQFPYYLIGKVVSKFEIDGVNKFLNGVGFLIGPGVVLTVAHNLTHMLPSGGILQTKKVCFFPLANGDFNLFDPVKSIKTFTNEEYIKALKTDDKDAQWLNDWGLIYLSAQVGNSITSLLEIEQKSEMRIIDNEWYSFFVNNQTLKMDNLVKETNSSKISIVGYTEYKDKYKNNSAYKFIQNFRNKKNQTEKMDEMGTNSIVNENQISQNSKKIFREIVNNNIDDKDKKINININIREDVTEGWISSSRYYHPCMENNMNKLSLNGTDYIVLGDENYNKNFDVTDAEKQIMSESKGKLVIDLTDVSNPNMIKYQISTYKGQSGSPLFLRYKRISNNKKGEYVYQFVGLHSRRGPSVGQKFYESEKMAAWTENLLTSEIPSSSHFEKQRNWYYSKEKDGSLKDIINNKQHKNSNSHDNKEADKQNEIVAWNGQCDFNLAVDILGDKVQMISSIIHHELEGFTNERDEDDSTKKLNSEFIYTKLLLNEKIQFTGLFKRNVTWSVLFSFGSKIFNVPKEYILLKDIANPFGLSIQNYNFDHNKKLCEVMEDPNNCTSMSFELMLNIKKYGEVITGNIFQKYMENYDWEESQWKKEFQKHMKGLFHLIFREINTFENIPLTHGKLFKKIRKMILNKLGMAELGKN